MPTTPKHALRYPASTDAPDVPTRVKNLADDTDDLLPIISSTEPTKKSGLVWRNSTTGLVQITDGTSWFLVSTSLWTTYTPTWTTSGTAPTLGNGTLSGSWQRSGKAITVRGSLLMGSTTTYGTGAFRFALPTAAAAVTPAFTGFPVWTGSAYGFDAGTSNRQGTSGIQSGGTYVVITGDTVAQWDVAIPHAWGNGDYLTWEITYEAAT